VVQDKRFRSKALAKLGEENRLAKSGEKFNSAQAGGEVKGGGGSILYRLAVSAILRCRFSDISQFSLRVYGEEIITQA
jgi:hypothetical protein